jgi:hypothetical protein
VREEQERHKGGSAGIVTRRLQDPIVLVMDHRGEVDMNALIKCREEKKEQCWCYPHEQTKSASHISDLLSLQRGSDAMDSPCTDQDSPEDDLNRKMTKPELSNAT